jgi:hypothetical protein
VSELGENNGGRPRNWGRVIAIQELARMYHEHTGRKPGRSHNGGKPGGPFFRFVAAFWRIFAGGEADQLSDEALAQLIRRALKTRIIYAAELPE